jgi:hypothetical protein
VGTRDRGILLVEAIAALYADKAVYRSPAFGRGLPA